MTKPDSTHYTGGTLNKITRDIKEGIISAFALLLAHFRRNLRWSWPPLASSMALSPPHFAGEGASHVTPTGR
jgi:hypothetical protein